MPELNPQPLPPSPEWDRAMPTGPAPGTKITAEYAAHVARDAYFWAWPLINVYSRRLASAQVKEPVKAGPVVQAPLNTVALLTDYVDPGERVVACPNQDVVYGIGSLALDLSPVVIQVPDFGERFWVYQIVDTRTDSFVTLGQMYVSPPGFYLLVGPQWQGEVPTGIMRVFRASTNTGFVGPRVFMDDTDADRQAIQDVLRQIMMYPLSDYDGTMKSTDWNTLPAAPAAAQGEEETQWVIPEKFVDQLPAVLADAPPLPGEAEAQLVKPLFQFRNFGLQLPHHWSMIANGAAFGTDYFTRTAVAKSNIFVNTPEAARYVYQDLDVDGRRLNGAHRYTVTFPNDGTPPVHGFWSLTLYNEHHFFAPNELNRYSLGTKNEDLLVGDDGSLTISVQAAPPPAAQRENWLPAPKDEDFSLFLRAYWPKVEITDGSWPPPPVQRLP